MLLLSANLKLLNLPPMSKYRYRVKEANLESLLFLAYNLEALPLGYPLLHEMENPPNNFQEPNGPLRFVGADSSDEQPVIAASADAGIVDITDSGDC